MRKDSFRPKGLRHISDLTNHTRAHNIPIEVTEEIIGPGWVNENKDLLQVLYERGWVDEENIGEYSLKGLKHQLDANGNVKDEETFKKRRLRWRNCSINCSPSAIVKSPH